MHPSDRAYRNTSIRLADLAVVTDVLHDLTFENCAILGPAVIVLQGGTTLTDCGFDGNEESLFWDLGDRSFVIGAISLVACTIVGCRFEGIGIAVPPAQRDAFRRGFGL